jgi:LPXTG-site transpeptidase (sortase) family protein
VDSAIEYVGVASDGSMSAPKKQEDVAWYQLGSRPGDIGTAVIAGHYGTWDNGKGSVFDNLDKLQKGDRVTVVDDGGTTITFTVKGRGNFGSSADATDIFRSSDSKAHLNLITCEGIWNANSQSYPSRLVIFTEKE